MFDDLGSDFNQLLASRGLRPVFQLLRQRKRPHEVAQIVGQSAMNIAGAQRTPLKVTERVE